MTSTTVSRSAELRQPLSGRGETTRQYFHALLRRLGWPASEPGAALQTLGITSSQHGEGVTTIASQLAATAASMGRWRVLLVDAHLERPLISRLHGGRGKPGFAEAVINGDMEGIEICTTHTTGPSILNAGALGGHPEQVYDSPAIAGLIDELRAQFDLVVFDLPPAGASHAPLRLSELLDGVVLVVKAHSGRRRDIRRVRDLLVHSNVRVLGAVLNRSR